MLRQLGSDGPHYSNVWCEVHEWRLDRWRQYFDECGFALEDIRGIRYHHLLKVTPRLEWNAAPFRRATKLLHQMIARRTVSASFASEFLLIARKNRPSPQ